LILHPPLGGIGMLRWQFFAGIVLAAVGGCLVTMYKDPKPAKAAEESATVAKP